MKPVYIVTDIETDGPVVGRNSMMSFASVAIDENGQELSNFEAVLSPLEGAKQDTATIGWFKGIPEAYAAATDNPQPPQQVMTDYIRWVREQPGDPIFAAHPLAFDGAWIGYYLQRFAGIRFLKGPWDGERLFYSAGLCIRTYAAAKLCWNLWDCQNENYPPEWLGDHAHTHRAIDDARGYACLLKYLMSIKLSDN